MTEPINHRGWAREFIRAAENAFDDEVTIDARETPTVAENIALAQVHATLALVEQQRIANIIAFTTGSGYNMAGDVAEQIAKDLGTWVEPGTTWGGGNGGR